MRALKVIGFAVAGWFVCSVVVGVGFSLLLAAAGGSNPSVESTVAGLAGLGGIIWGVVYGVRRTTTPQRQE